MVPIFDKALLPPGAGVRAAVQMPSAARLAGLDRLELDLQLGCPGPRDNSCPEVGGWLGGLGRHVWAPKPAAFCKRACVSGGPLPQPAVAAVLCCIDAGGGAPP